MIRALIFDFDGLIIDTEKTILESWQVIYKEFGLELSVAQWVTCIGTEYSDDTFDPVAELARQAEGPLDWADIQARRAAIEMALVARQPLLPGVESLLKEARARGLKLAVASSSPHDWVDGHLAERDLTGYFDVVICADDVAQVKPAPDLFLKAAEAVGVRPEEAVVLEDSPHGLLAARKAGMFGVAVPHALTRQLDLSDAHLQVNSLAELPLDELLAAANHR